MTTSAIRTVHDGTLYIPLEGKRRIFPFVTVPRVPRIAAFRASDLQFLWSAPLPKQQKAGWCAINSKGVLLSSNSRVTPRDREGRRTAVSLPHRRDDPARSSTGSCSGTSRERRSSSTACRAGRSPTTTISTSAAATTRIPTRAGASTSSTCERSGASLRSTNGSGSFNYEFHPGGSTDEEPEGLTYWDLDGRNAPGIQGQLHAILLDNDANGDDVYFKHYRVQGL